MTTALPANSAVVVTGGTSGIGLGVAEAFVRLGRPTVCISRHRTDGFSALAQHAPTGTPEPMYVSADVSDPDQMHAAAEEVAAAGMKVGTVVAAAGINVRKAALEVDETDLRRMADVNLLGTLYTFRAFAPAVLSSPGGRFVAIGSVSGQWGMQLRTMYSATKGGVSAMCRSLAMEWAEHQATVNCVAPGLIDTPLTRGYLDAFPHLEVRALADTPLGRLGLPSDVANVVTFLASPATGFMTGQTLCVDGGMFVGNTWW
jgi:NAD(P)-dependent dehydrogenase (short-subunit alcohol dehydrogenase family)